MKLSTRRLGQSVPDNGGQRWLYRRLSVELVGGAFAAIIGPNGAGKSTLLRSLSGIDAPKEGEVRLGGMGILQIPGEERARRLAFLPQRVPLYHDLSVREVVMLGRAPYLSRFGPPGRKDHAQVDAALEQVELRRLSARGVLSLSGGEFQRVMLARMLATEAPLLVLDEPTTALDIGHALALMELCRGLVREGRAVIMAVHELDLARRYADVVLCLDGHGGATFGTAEEVMTVAAIERVFRVRVHASADGLRFFPAASGDT